MMRRIMIAAGLTLSGALLVSGCALVGGDNSHKKQPGKAAAPSSPAASPAAKPAGPAPAKKTVTYQGLAKGGTVTVGFQGLQVRGQLAQLALTWTPNVPGSTDTDSWSVSAMSNGSGLGGGGIDLVDTQNLKRYVIVTDSNGHHLGSSVSFEFGIGDAVGGPEAKSGQTVSTAYTYAAPPPNVTSIDVYADDRLLFNVPITR